MGMLRMNKLKRICSCLSVLAICIASAIGLPANANVNTDFAKITVNKTAIKEANESLVLYAGCEISNVEDNKVAGHYSHRSHYSHTSHVSHQSHYSARY